MASKAVPEVAVTEKAKDLVLAVIYMREREKKKKKDCERFPFCFL